MKNFLTGIRQASKIQLALCALLVFAAFAFVAVMHPGASILGSLACAPIAFGLMGATTGLEKTQKCTAAIATAFTIAKFGADDDTMSLATAATDNMLGIFQHTTSAANDPVRIMLSGISDLKLGYAVTRGAPLTSDASGKGYPAVSGQNIIGFALKTGAANDIIPVRIAPGILTSAAGVNGASFKVVATAIFDVAAQTGGEAAVADYPLGVIIPDNAIITLAYGDIITAFVSTSNDGTIALKAQSSADLLAAVDADTLSGLIALIPVGTAATMIKMTAARELTLSVAVHKMTAGKAVFFVEYVPSI